MSHADTLKARASQINAELEKYFSDLTVPQAALYEAMRYSLLAGGKRIRPVLTLELCRALGGSDSRALPFACAIEMVHTYSLIHDDLPCMDNDDYRRGRLTNHPVFGECTAVLAGDALLTAAFSTALTVPDEISARAAKILADCAGERGMVAGQILDTTGDTAPDEARLMLINTQKTASLLRAACLMGVAAAGGNDRQFELAAKYADSLGMAFQIRDDLLDVLGDAALLGKSTGSDAACGKTTLASLLGREKASALVNEYTKEAVCAARELCGEASFPEWLALEMAGREK